MADQKRGGAWRQVDLDQAAEVAQDPAGDMAAVSEALGQLAAHDPVKAELVKLRFFAGLSVERGPRGVRASGSVAGKAQASAGKRQDARENFAASGRRWRKFWN
jgi:hypothetical protein